MGRWEPPQRQRVAQERRKARGLGIFDTQWTPGVLAVWAASLVVGTWGGSSLGVIFLVRGTGSGLGPQRRHPKAAVEPSAPRGNKLQWACM